MADFPDSNALREAERELARRTRAHRITDALDLLYARLLSCAELMEDAATHIAGGANGTDYVSSLRGEAARAKATIEAARGHLEG